MLYLWLKVLHIIAVISWMAGLLYLPRLFVNHAQPHGDDAKEMLAGMERRLMVFIMRPAALATLITGGALLSRPETGIDWGQGWIWVKLASVFVLLGMHGACEVWRKQFATGTNRHSDRFFRIVNEVPTLAMILIVAMVILRPF